MIFSRTHSQNFSKRQNQAGLSTMCRDSRVWCRGFLAPPLRSGLSPRYIIAIPSTDPRHRAPSRCVSRIRLAWKCCRFLKPRKHPASGIVPAYHRRIAMLMAGQEPRVPRGIVGLSLEDKMMQIVHSQVGLATASSGEPILRVQFCGEGRGA